MCWFEKDDILFWVNMEEYDQRLMLRLRAPDHRHYNNFFTIERPLAPGQNPEIIFTIPFDDVTDISYAPPTGDDRYTVCFDVIGGDYRLRDIKVQRHCFNFLEFKKMLRIFKKSKKSNPAY